jgi:hypothetical protein
LSAPQALATMPGVGHRLAPETVRVVAGLVLAADHPPRGAAGVDRAVAAGGGCVRAARRKSPGAGE